MKIRHVLFAAAALACMGCDEDALRLAGETRDILAVYEQQLLAQIGIEEAAYEGQTRIAADAAREQADSNLASERVERARALALDTIAGKQLPAKWREIVREYAKADYTVQRERLAAEMGSEGKHLARLQALEIDAQKIRAIRLSLDALARREGVKQQAAGLAGFAKHTSTGLDALICAALADEIKQQTEAEKHATDAAAKQLAKQSVAAARQARTTKGCPS